MFNETHFDRRTCRSATSSSMRHDGCGGRAGKAELLTGIEGVSSRPVRTDRAAGRVAEPLRRFLLVVIGLAVFVILVLVFHIWQLEIMAPPGFSLSARKEGPMSFTQSEYWRSIQIKKNRNDKMRDEGSRSAMRSVVHMYDSLAQASQRYADRFRVPPEG